MKRILTSLSTSAMLLASSAVPVLAQDNIPIDLEAGVEQGLTTLSIGGIVSGIIRLLVVAAAVIFFIWLVLGGIRWITSGGDKAKTEEARNQITAALVGLVIVFSAWAIGQLINVLFGVNIFELQITGFGSAG